MTKRYVWAYQWRYNMAIELHVNREDLDSITEIELDGDEYLYRLYWQEQYNRWYIDLFDVTGNPLVVGKKLMVGSPTVPHRPLKGELFVVSRSGNNDFATINNLGLDVVLVYLTEAEIDRILIERTEYALSDFIEKIKLLEPNLDLTFLNGDLFEFLDGEQFETIRPTQP